MRHPRPAAGILGLPLWVCLLGCALVACQPQERGPYPGEATTAPAWFEERASAAGLDFRYQSGHDGERFLFPEIMGGGAALLDADGDGLLDIYLVQGGSLAAGPVGPGNRLFLNRGEGRFEDATGGAGVGDRGYGMGVAVGDFDADGDSDLYVSNLGPNVLLRNEGGGRFTDVTERAGVGDPGWGTSAAFLDFDRDGWLDLFVANYVQWSPDSELDCFDRSGASDYCSPVSYDRPAPDVLYRNLGDGRFEDVSVTSGLRADFGNGLGVAVLDFDDDDFLDIFVANDQTPNQLWRNLQGGGFEDVAVVTGCAVSQTGQAKAGMGVDVADVDDDGDLDLLVVNLHTQTDSFFRNRGEYFSEETALVGLGSASRPFTRFGVGLEDFDRDGRLDLYQANGRVTLPERPPDDGADPFAEPNILLRGVAAEGFALVEPGGGTAERLVHTSRAAAFGDLDNDGDVDIVVANRDAPVYLLMNRTGGGRHWIGLEVLNGAGSPALGARVIVTTPTRTLRRDIRTASSYLASNDPRLQLGLGDEAEVSRVEVRWADGEVQDFGPQPIDQYTTLRRGG